MSRPEEQRPDAEPIVVEVEDGEGGPSAADLLRDPRTPTMLVLRGLDGSEMPMGDPEGWLEVVRQTERDLVALAMSAEAIHAEHVREFGWMKRDGMTADQCGNCQRWARYATAVARAQL